MGQSPTSLQTPSLGIGSSVSDPGKQVFRQGTGGPLLDPEQIPQSSQNNTSPFQLKEIQAMEKSIIIETAAAAMDELEKLLQIKEPVWIQSLTEDIYFIEIAMTSFFPRQIILKPLVPGLNHPEIPVS